MVSTTAIDITQKKHSFAGDLKQQHVSHTININNGRTTLPKGIFGGDTKESSSPNHQFTCHHHTSTQGCPQPQIEPGSATLFIYRYHAVGSWETMWKFPRIPPHFPPLRTEPTCN
jgi:hypothetical protein